MLRFFQDTPQKEEFETTINFVIHLSRENGKDMTQTYCKSPYTYRKKQNKKQRYNTKTPLKTSITQRLRTDLGGQSE